MEFRQLLPTLDSFDLDERLAALSLADQAPGDRPYIVANFVASADGRATLEGKSGGLGDDGDRAMFHGLREQMDAVMAGTRTLGAEHYGRILGKQERRDRRLKRGLPPEPLAVVISRSGQIPTDAPLFAEPEARIVVFSPTELDTSQCAAHIEHVRLDPGELTLTTAMRTLRTDFGVKSLLCEGGPTVFGALLHENLVDELFVTISPKLAGGGTGPTITSGPELAEPAELHLKWLLERNETLFARYGLGA